MSAPPDVPPVVARAFDASRKRGYASFWLSAGLLVPLSLRRIVVAIWRMLQ